MEKDIIREANGKKFEKKGLVINDSNTEYPPPIFWAYIVFDDTNVKHFSTSDQK